MEKKSVVTNIWWDWTDFGIVLRVFKNASHSDFELSLDVQIGFLEIWTRFWRR
jgi:hypothetical protein